MRATLTPYRFVCDVATFTELFTTTSNGCRIPDTSAFQCCWRAVPYASVASAHEHAHAHNNNNSNNNNNNNSSNSTTTDEGCTPLAYFKSAGSDMALTFTPRQHTVCLDGVRAAVLTFVLQPSEYEYSASAATVSGSGGRTAPVLARGTLDPAAYVGLPRKSYSVKLRDTHGGGVVGKFVFGLLVQDEAAAAAAPLTTAAPTHAERSTQPRRDEVDHAASRSAAVAAAAAASSSSSSRLAPPRHGGSASDVAAAVRATRDDDDTNSNNNNNNNNSCRQGDKSVCVLEMVVEGVAIKPEAIDLHHPASLLLGGEYELRLRYGDCVCGTDRCVCSSPREVSFRCQRLSLALAPGDDGDNDDDNNNGNGSGSSSDVVGGNTTTSSSSVRNKLRFALCENGVQVAGFSLDARKFRVAPGAWKAYAIPFRYHPTRQAATLDVSIRKLHTTAAAAAAATTTTMTTLHRDRALPPPPPPPPRSAAMQRTSSAVRVRHHNDGDEDTHTRSRSRHRSHAHEHNDNNSRHGKNNSHDDGHASRGSTTASRTTSVYAQRLVRIDNDNAGNDDGGGSVVAVARADKSAVTADNVTATTTTTIVATTTRLNAHDGDDALTRLPSRLRGRHNSTTTTTTAAAVPPPPPPRPLSTRLLQQRRSTTPLRHTHVSDDREAAAAPVAPLPSSSPYRAPDNVEAYLESVLARIERQQSRHGAHTHSSLVESWSEWQQSRAGSRASSRASSIDRRSRRDDSAHHHSRHHRRHDDEDDDNNGGGSPHRRREYSTSRHATASTSPRSASASAYSRGSSVSSITSRRATSPLPTKSFVQYSMLHPYTPSDGGYRHNNNNNNDSSSLYAGAMRVRSSFRPRGHTPPRLYAVPEAHMSRCNA